MLLERRQRGEEIVTDSVKNAHLVFNLHLVQNGGPVVCDSQVPIRAYKHLVHALWTQ